jgi:hypothetical protein
VGGEAGGEARCGVAAHFVRNEAGASQTFPALKPGPLLRAFE